MAIRRAVLLIADIGGYTRYMQWNKMHLAHAQRTVGDLLEAVIDAGKGLKLAKLEGDAAFFWAPDADAGEVVKERLSRMRRAFLEKRARIVATKACDCESCDQVSNLSLKFVTHEGEVAEQKVKRLTELAGVDVILVHRMLKNDVPVSEYVLMTDTVKQRLEPQLATLTQPLTHDFEGIGQTETHYIDLHQAGEALPTAAEPGFFGRLWARMRLNARVLLYMLGIGTPAEGFRNLDRALPQAKAPEALPEDAGAK